MARTLSEGGVRYEIPYKGSFTQRKPKFTLNHVLSYRDSYDKYGLPRDVMKTIDKSIKAVEDYAKAAKGKDVVSDPKLQNEYFKVLREYYTSEGPSNTGMKPIVRFASFLGYKNAVKVLKDLKTLKTELKKAESTPEYED